MFACSCLTHPFEAKACMLLSRKSLRSTCILFGYSFYIFLQLSVNLIKLIRNAFGNKTCLRVLVSPTSLKQKHACNASQFSLFFFKHARSCDEKSLRNTCTLFRCSFYIFLQLNVNSIKLIRNVFGNKTCLRVLASPTFLKQKHACYAFSYNSKCEVNEAHGASWFSSCTQYDNIMVMYWIANPVSSMCALASKKTTM